MTPAKISGSKKLSGETRETAAKLLQQVLRRTRLTARADRIWEDWPSLRLVGAKLCWFVSPLIVTAEHNVLNDALHGAISAYHENSGEPRDKARAFLHSIQQIANRLARLRMSARDETDNWLIWTGDEPLMGWLTALGVSSVQIIERQRAVGSAQMAVRLMSYVCTMRELRLAGLAITQEEGLEDA